MERIMDDFQSQFAQYEKTLPPQFFKCILKDYDQFKDAMSPFNGKSKEIVRGNSSNTREHLIAAMFSMKDVCESMFKTVSDLAAHVSNKLPIADNIVNVIENSFNKMSADLSHNLMKALLPSKAEPTVEEKHIVLVENKDQNATNFDSMGWNQVVQKTLAPKLKNVPIEKAILSKDGKGCIFLPNKKAQEEVKSALENEFNVSTASKPRKSILPKLKLIDIDVDKYHDKSELRSSILAKNDDINDLVQKGSTFDVLFIDTKWKYAIVKVSPEVRSVVNKFNRIFIDMESVRTRDHFQPIQCYACQKFGHIQGSPDCAAKKDESTCLYCGCNHMSKNCPDKRSSEKHRCINCQKSSVPAHQQNFNHKSTSLACPFMIKEMNSLIMRTAGLDSTAAKKYIR